MITIGYLHYRKNPERLNKAYAFAAVAKAEGIEMLYFSPGAVDFENKKIKGYVYNSGKWTVTIRGFPHVIYNAVGFSKEKQDDVVAKLMEQVPFTSYSIGSKMTVFKNLTKYKQFAEYLIPTETVISTAHLFNLMDKYKKLIFKPSSGCQGVDVYFAAKANGAYEIFNGNAQLGLTREAAEHFIANKLSAQTYIAQPYINSRTNLGHPYDLRLHVQKNIIGEWTVVKIYPRISVNGGIVCNISGGGYTTDIDIFLKEEFGNEHKEIKARLTDFALGLAAHMDKIQNELYDEDLDELGIDIGLNESQKIKIYEINWRPGYPPAMNADFSAVKNLVHYSMFLARSKGECAL